jgi:plastocyanin domain-containing protein
MDINLFFTITNILIIVFCIIIIACLIVIPILVIKFLISSNKNSNDKQDCSKFPLD